MKISFKNVFLYSPGISTFHNCSLNKKKQTYNYSIKSYFLSSRKKIYQLYAKCVPRSNRKKNQN